jgi:hypothetical protein
MEGLGAGERRPEIRLSRHECQATVSLDGLALAVEPEDLAPTLCGADEPQQQTDRGRLASPVGPEVSRDLALGDFEVEVVEGSDAGVSLGEAFCAYSRWSHWRPPPL